MKLIIEEINKQIQVRGVNKDNIMECLYILERARDMVKEKRKRAILKNGILVEMES